MTKRLNELDAKKLISLAEVAADLRRSGAVSVYFGLDDSKYCSDIGMLIVVVATKSRARKIVSETIAAAKAKGVHLLGSVAERAAGYDETYQALSFHSATDPLVAPEAA